MPLRELFLRVLSGYRDAIREEFTGHPIRELLRLLIPQELERIIGPESDLLVRGSAGMGQWTASPWVAILDPLVTDSAQRGYYPVYLFREDLTGLYLSLNQGMTEAKENYRSDAKKALKGRAEDFRNRLGNLPQPFVPDSIDLRPSSSANNSAFYEAGNICSVFYDAGAVPNDEALRHDLLEILKLYALLSEGESTQGISTGIEDDEIGNEFIEDLGSFRLHKRIERNPKISKAVKKIHGLKCQVCGFEFAKFYPGVTGNDYIEAHHLVPISTLKGKKLKRDAKADFAVLCANCHRMIHRTKEPWNLNLLKSAIAG